MEQNPQEIFNKIQKIKKDQKELRRSFTDSLNQTPGYKEAVDEMKELREKKKKIETQVRQDFATELNKLDDLKIDLESEMEVLSDLVFNKLVKGEKVEIVDEYENNYEPIFRVNFKKVY
jgi:hypothetical protein